jgi:hypothetical protein
MAERLLSSELHSTVALAGLSPHLRVKVVLDHDNFLAAVWVRAQDPLNGRVLAGAFAASNVPTKFKLFIVVSNAPPIDLKLTHCGS